MFVVVYLWDVKPDRKEDFVSSWVRVTKAAIATRGSLGSRLHMTQTGQYLAYAQWPDRESWQNFVRSAPPDLEAFKVERDCIVSENLFEPLFVMEVLEDLWDKRRQT